MMATTATTTIAADTTTTTATTITTTTTTTTTTNIKSNENKAKETHSNSMYMRSAIGMSGNHLYAVYVQRPVAAVPCSLNEHFIRQHTGKFDAMKEA